MTTPKCLGGHVTEASKKQNQSPPVVRPFYLTGWGIAIFSYITCGVALPFLLWARGPKTKERKRKIVVRTLVTCLIVLPLPVIGAFMPDSLEDSSNSNRSATTDSSLQPVERPDADWQDVTDAEIDSESVKFWSNDKYMISARIMNESGVPTHYRIKLDIEVVGGSERRAAFCTTTPAESKSGFQEVNLKVFRGDDGGESWAGFLDRASDISFSFSWSMVSVEKSSRWCGAH